MEPELTRRFIQSELAYRSLSQSDLARLTNLSYAQLNNVLTGIRAHTKRGKTIRHQIAECFGYHSWEDLESAAASAVHRLDDNPNIPINKAGKIPVITQKEITA